MPSDKGIVHVIDDDDALRESLTFLLRTASIDVQSYSSASAFLDSLPAAENLSCVITDVRMPGMSGIDLLKRLKELKISVPVIVITGHGDVAARGRSHEFRRDRLPGKALRRRGAAGQRADRRDSSARETQSAAWSVPPSKAAWRFSPNASATCLPAWSPAMPTSRSRSISASARRTVEIYRANLMDKMQAGSLSDLVRMALIVELV